MVSKKPLLDRVKPLPVSADEIARLQKIEKDLKAAYAAEASRSFKEDSDALAAAGYTSTPTYTEMQREIIKTAAYRPYWGARYKLPSPGGAIYISALGFIPYPQGWDIRYAVIRETEGRLEQVGEIEGCIAGFRDLDEDGVPEVFTSLCDNYEGSVYRYWSLMPTVRPVVERSQ